MVNVKLPKTVKLKTYVATTLVLTVLLLASVGYVLTSNGTTVTITPQSYIETASYVIEKIGGTYYAKNGSTGEIEFSGTNATQVINSCVDSNVDIFLSSGLYDFTTYNTAIVLDSVENVTLRGTYGTRLKVMENMTGTHHQVIRIIHCKNIKIESLAVYSQNSVTDTFISIYDSENVQIYDVKIYNQGKGIAVDGSAVGANKNIWIENCYFYGLGTTAGYAIYTTDTSIITVRNCIFEKLDISTTHAIYSGTNTTNFNYVGNHIKEAGDAFSIRSDNTGTIANNVIYNVTNGVRIDANSRIVVIGNYIFYGNIKCQSNNCTISGNHLYYSGAIQLLSANYTTVTGNSLAYMNVGGNYGIYMSSAYYNVISSNTIHDAKYWGIYEASGDYNIISNVIADGATGGIHTTGSNTQVHLSYNGTSWIS